MPRRSQSILLQPPLTNACALFRNGFTQKADFLKCEPFFIF